MAKQLDRAVDVDETRRAIVQLAAVLGLVRALRIAERRPEWRRKDLTLVEWDDVWCLFEKGVLAAAWGSESALARALHETEGEWFEELSQVIGLLGWLGWEVEVDIESSAARGGQQGVEEKSWYGAQLFGAIGVWLMEDADARRLMEDSVARTPRYRVDGERWLLVHLDLAEQLASVAAGVKQRHQEGQRGRPPHPGDLVILSDRLDPRVRVVLGVEPVVGDVKVSFFEQESDDRLRVFMASRVVTLPWIGVARLLLETG